MADIYELEIVRDSECYTLREVCQCRDLASEFVVQCVEYGITDVSGGSEQEAWRFPVRAIPRLEKAFRLHRDLDLDFSALALVMELLDDIDTLNDRIDSLNRRLQEWEPD